jgi:hypothetical protein
MPRRIKNTSKTREELLNNTIYGFTAQTRCSFAANDFCCYYREDTNNSCAIGRELSVNKCNELEAENVDIYSLETLLPKRLRDMGINFLSAVQNLHDNADWWNETGLSETGKKEAERIIESYNLDADKVWAKNIQ